MLGSKRSQVGAYQMAADGKMGFDQPPPKTSSTPTGESKKSKSRIGEGFIAEISELGTFEEAAPMETWSMRLLH